MSCHNHVDGSVPWHAAALVMVLPIFLALHCGTVSKVAHNVMVLAASLLIVLWHWQ